MSLVWVQKWLISWIFSIMFDCSDGVSLIGELPSYGNNICHILYLGHVLQPSICFIYMWMSGIWRWQFQIHPCRGVVFFSMLDGRTVYSPAPAGMPFKLRLLRRLNCFVIVYWCPIRPSLRSGNNSSRLRASKLCMILYISTRSLLIRLISRDISFVGFINCSYSSFSTSLIILVVIR